MNVEWESAEYSSSSLSRVNVERGTLDASRHVVGFVTNRVKCPARM